MTALKFIRSDYERRFGPGFTLTKALLMCFRSPVFLHICLYRLSHSGGAIWRWLYRRSQYHTGIQLSPDCRIGGGLSFEHYGTIVIGTTTIGNHCTIFHGVTIGYAGRPGKGGTPVVGDNVVIGAGATLVGPIKIGNNVFIGANAYVCKDVPDNAVVGALPGTIISYNGTKGYFGN